MEYKRQILVSWKKKLSALLENAVDGIFMERKRIVVSSWAWKKKGKHKFAGMLEQAVIYVDM